MTRSGAKTQSTTVPITPGVSSTTSASTSATASASVRERRKPAEKTVGTQEKSNDGLSTVDDSTTVAMPSWTVRNRWIVFAIASGACAAFNGVFAKLTTNDLSTHIAQGISGFLGLTDLERFVEVVVRCTFFGLNLAFNGVMWTLFTQALAKGHSTTQVSIMNTSTNFVITALLGLAIFSESLPPLWWAGAALLVAGNVIIGRGKQEEAASSDEVEYHGDDGDDVSPGGDLGMGYESMPQVELALPVEKDSDDEDVALLGDLN
ncbi:hypothetical protein F4677DRAFT_447835 [Hypoxylon crocopeplum]|nr:hypothetical protein F4677DRAFT_447835 [Hypoxylon crocopeplum]